MPVGTHHPPPQTASSRQRALRGSTPKTWCKTPYHSPASVCGIEVLQLICHSLGALTQASHTLTSGPQSRLTALGACRAGACRRPPSSAASESPCHKGRSCPGRPHRRLMQGREQTLLVGLLGMLLLILQVGLLGRLMIILVAGLLGRLTVILLGRLLVILRLG